MAVMISCEIFARREDFSRQALSSFPRDVGGGERRGSKFGSRRAGLDHYAEKSSRRAQIFLERLSAEQAGGIDSASTPNGPAVLNRFIHLCGSRPDAD